MTTGMRFKSPAGLMFTTSSAQNGVEIQMFPCTESDARAVLLADLMDTADPDFTASFMADWDRTGGNVTGRTEPGPAGIEYSARWVPFLGVSTC